MPDAPSTAKRTLEIEEVTNRYFVHPISRACVGVFARWGISPNAVSLMGVALGAGAGLAYYHFPTGPMAFAGFLLMLGWHVMDGADGQLARLTGRTSALGEVLDGVCDYLTFILVYVALAAAATPALGAWAWVAAALAGASHVVQASAYEFRRQTYEHWGYGKDTAAARPLGDTDARFRQKHGVARVFAALQNGYLRLQHRIAARDDGSHEALASAFSRAEHAGPKSEERLRAGYRTVQAGAVRRWGVLSSNYRTLAIFLFCLAGAPVLFFAFEIVVFNAIFLLLRHRQRKHDRVLRTWLAEQRPAERPAASPAPSEAAACV